MSRKSRWTQIYWDADDNGMFAYIRFVPDFLDLEAAGFPHGISIGGIHYATEEDACNDADVYDIFFDKMYTQLASIIYEV